ncbi:MAG: NAD(P)H-binding protein [Desulfobacteraceae bacterium]|nr:NAD(P)H-binding protein [Desulfobacteraceae bacterium]
MKRKRGENILLTGTTGFVGGRLLRELSKRGLSPRCLVRSVDKFRRNFSDYPADCVFEGDLFGSDTLRKALEGVDLAYYLVHSMGGHSLFDVAQFAERDRWAARNFVRAANKAGVKRIVYLGGLGEIADNLSKHLMSRHEVADILESGLAKATIFRAANILGAGGAPFEILRYLVERLPLMVVPRWVDTRCQPIDIEDAIAYLAGCIDHPATEGGEFDIGGPDIITYREMMLIYARVRGLKRVVISLPLLTPRLSSLWISLLSPVPAGVVSPLLEGLRNEVVCRENRIRQILPLNLTPLEVSICKALVEVSRGPGRLASLQACFLTKSCIGQRERRLL